MDKVWKKIEKMEVASPPPNFTNNQARESLLVTTIAPNKICSGKSRKSCFGEKLKKLPEVNSEVNNFFGIFKT